jgi:hypothetical protein
MTNQETVIKRGAFTFVISSGKTERSTEKYLHVYENGKRVTSYGNRLNHKTAKFEPSLVLIEACSAVEIAIIVSEIFGSINYVKVNPKGIVKKYSGLKSAWTLWSRKNNK